MSSRRWQRRPRSATSACATSRRSRRRSSESPHWSRAPRKSAPTAGARRRPLGRTRLARRHGPRARPRWRALARRARRPEPARDIADRQRPRDAACGRSWLAGPEFESDEYPLPAVDPRRIALVGFARSTRRAGAAGRARGAGVHDERPRPDGRRDRDAEALEHVTGDGFVHLSLDMDVLDPEVAPGVGTPVRGGLSYREAHLAMELIAESGILTRSRWSRSTRSSTARTRPPSWPSSWSRAPSAPAFCNTRENLPRGPALVFPLQSA